MHKSAIITGVCGQDGSYLAELLLSKGYYVTGLARPTTRDNRINLTNATKHPNFNILEGDLLNADTIIEMVDSYQPDELYHLGALTHVGQSFDNPTLTMQTNAIATTRILDAIVKYKPSTKFYFAATSEMFPSNNIEELGAHSPYAASKVASYLTTQLYREAYDIFAVNGIAYNHESCRRGKEFVTRKIGLGVQHYKRTGTPVILGNIDASRDWHHAKDTVKGMYLAMQHHTPLDWVFASNTSYSVYQFAKSVCRYLDVDYNDAIHVVDTERRPWDVDYLIGDATVAQQELKWSRDYTIMDIVKDVCKEVWE